MNHLLYKSEEDKCVLEQVGIYVIYVSRKHSTSEYIFCCWQELFSFLLATLFCLITQVLTSFLVLWHVNSPNVSLSITFEFHLMLLFFFDGISTQWFYPCPFWCDSTFISSPCPWKWNAFGISLFLHRRNAFSVFLNLSFEK